MFNLQHTDPDAVPVRDAATVMLLRDGVEGMEVCMLVRNLRSDFVGGAFVFPGGAVDPSDGLAEVETLCAGLTDAEASRHLDLPSGGLAYWVAAVRESFEEAGVLVAVGPDDEVVSFVDPAVAERFVAHRRAVDSGSRRLVEVLRDEELRIDAAGIHYFSRWITPLGAPRRYDTRFFVAAAPPEQEPLHDDHEVVASRWFTPAEALRRHDEGEITMIFPTVRTLVALDRFDSAVAALDHARSLPRVDAVLPLMRESPDGIRIVLPGDPEDTGGTYDAITAQPVDEDLPE
ncbi:MAG: NUDIX hydrolase [Actinomycetes bacterium]